MGPKPNPECGTHCSVESIHVDVNKVIGNMGSLQPRRLPVTPIENETVKITDNAFVLLLIVPEYSFCSI